MLAAWGAAGLGRSAWERGMQIAAGSWFSAFFLGRESGNPKKFCRTSSSLGLVVVWDEIFYSSATALGAARACKRNPTQLAMVRLALVLLGASSSAVALLGKVSSPGVAGWLCTLQACSCCSGPWSWWGDSKTPHKALPLWACCLYTNKYMCLQVNPPFLCEHMLVDLLTTLSMLWHLLAPTGEQQLTASPLQLVSDLIILIPD